MMRFFLSAAALGLLAACQPAVPDSGAGVGFDRVDADRAAMLNRNAQLEGRAPTQPALTSPSQITQQSLDGSPPVVTPGPDVTVSPVTVGAGGAAPQAVTNSAGISQEQDFDAVSGQRGIEDDAARLAAARAQYVQIQPGALPTRAGSDVPNIVEYALRTNNPRGTAIYSRSAFGNAGRTARNCGRYASPDLAQEEFLSMGGPQRDRRGLDPDGDGFACDWDPSPFRNAIRAPSGS